MKWTASPTVVWTETSGEIHLYDTDAGHFHTLNLSAAAVWRQLVRTGERDAVVSGIVEELGAQNDNQRRLIATDTDRLIEDLAGRGLIVAEPADEPTG